MFTAYEVTLRWITNLNSERGQGPVPVNRPVLRQGERGCRQREAAHPNQQERKRYAKTQQKKLEIRWGRARHVLSMVPGRVHRFYGGMPFPAPARTHSYRIRIFGRVLAAVRQG